MEIDTERGLWREAETNEQGRPETDEASPAVEAGMISSEGSSGGVGARRRARRRALAFFGGVDGTTASGTSEPTVVAAAAAADGKTETTPVSSAASTGHVGLIDNDSSFPSVHPSLPPASAPSPMLLSAGTIVGMNCAGTVAEVDRARTALTADADVERMGGGKDSSKGGGSNPLGGHPRTAVIEAGPKSESTMSPTRGSGGGNEATAALRPPPPVIDVVVAGSVELLNNEEMALPVRPRRDGDFPTVLALMSGTRSAVRRTPNAGFPFPRSHLRKDTLKIAGKDVYGLWVVGGGGGVDFLVGAFVLQGARGHVRQAL